MSSPLEKMVGATGFVTPLRGLSHTPVSLRFACVLRPVGLPLRGLSPAQVSLADSREPLRWFFIKSVH